MRQKIDAANFSDINKERIVIMQVVVVKAPKILKGILRIMFKMNKPM